MSRSGARPNHWFNGRLVTNTKQSGAYKVRIGMADLHVFYNSMDLYFKIRLCHKRDYRICEGRMNEIKEVGLKEIEKHQGIL